MEGERNGAHDFVRSLSLQASLPETTMASEVKQVLKGALDLGSMLVWGRAKWLNLLN